MQRLLPSAGVLAVLMALAQPGAHAQEYPKQPITIVVQFPEKSIGDVMSRLVAERLQASLGQAVNVQNVPGKAGTIAVAQVVKAAPDGYTLVFAGDAPLTTALVLFKSLGYDPRRDLAPIGQLVATQNAFIVPASGTAKSIADLAKAAKERPGQLSYAHAGIGLSTHVAGELLKKHAGIDLKPVALTAPADLFKAVEDGQVLFGIISVGSAAPRVKEGKLRALAVTGAQRAALLPDVPTLAEGGYTGHDASAWFALLAPKGTPEPVIARLHAEATKMISSTEVADRLVALGARPSPGTPAELGKRIDTTIATLADLLKDTPKQK